MHCLRLILGHLHFTAKTHTKIQILDTYITYWHMNSLFTIAIIYTIISVFPYFPPAYWSWEWLTAAFGASLIFSVQDSSHVKRKLQLPKHARICHLSCMNMTDTRVIEQRHGVLCCSPGEVVPISLSTFEEGDVFCDSPAATKINTPSSTWVFLLSVATGNRTIN